MRTKKLGEAPAGQKIGRNRSARSAARDHREPTHQVRMALRRHLREQIKLANQKSLIEDLEAQRRAIFNQVAKSSDPTEALELMWRFVTIANSVFERCDDSRER